MTIKSNKFNKGSPIKRKEVENSNEEIQKFKKRKLDEHNDIKKAKGKSTANRDFKSTSQNKDSLSTDNPENEKPDWNKVKKDRKELKIKRREKDCESSELYTLSVQAKKIWEHVRRQDCKAETKETLCKELHTLIKGKISSLIYAHDTVRVIETLVGAASDEIRTHMFLELKDDLVNLSKNKYARFFVIKLLRSGSKIQKTAVMKAMEGNIVKLMKHKIASDVVELAYNDYANMKQRASMLQEFFGPRFRLFKEELTTLKQALEKYPDNKDNILKEISVTLEPIIEKGVFTNTIIHTLLKEYLYACDDDSKRAIADSLKENLLPIIHTRDGARVAMMCLWNGTAKQRKLIIKSFKGHYLKIATDEQGYMVILAALDCVDDTVLLKKVLLSEILADVDKLTVCETGRKVLRYLVSPRDKKFFPTCILSVLQEGDNNSNSKKNLTDKFKELQTGEGGIGEPVLKLFLEYIRVWAKDTHWVLLLGAALQNLQGESLELIFKGIADICAEPFIPGEEKHFLDLGHVTKMVSNQIRCDKQRHELGQPTFTNCLLLAAEDELRGWSLVNRGCFLLANLFETEIPEVVEKMTIICMPLSKKLKKQTFPGAAILLKKF